jgi:uncharacterized cupredoxin-like copper-binding protein
MKRTLLIWVLVSGFVLTACGGSNSPTTNLNVTLTDFMFSPNQFTVPAGQEITLDARNSGGVIHNFVIMDLGQTVGTEYTREDEPNIYWKTELPAGASITTAFTAPTEPGDYEVICSTPGHVQAGMVAKMTVVAGE